jgi:hypothetical protein
LSAPKREITRKRKAAFTHLRSCLSLTETTPEPRHPRSLDSDLDNLGKEWYSSRRNWVSCQTRKRTVRLQVTSFECFRRIF